MDQQLNQLVQRIYPGCRIIEIRPLTGGVSAQVTAVELELAGGSRKRLVARLYGETDATNNPKVAETEFRLLSLLRDRKIPVPEPHYFDSSRSLFPRPLLVTDFVEGETVFDPSDLNGFLQALTLQLLAIHRVIETPDELPFLPRSRPLSPANLGKCLIAADLGLSVVEVAPLLAMDSAPTTNASTLLHGDYWPGNILWRDRQVAAVIDWEDASLGDPLADVANCRLELLWAFGYEAMEGFTSRYRSGSPIEFGSLPYWDLCAAVGPARNFAAWTDDEALTERRRLRLQGLVRDALARLR